MRGFETAFSRLPATRAFLAGAAILAGASVTRVDAQTISVNDDTAFAVPRLDTRNAAGIALPQPLPPSEAARLRRIFALQQQGEMDRASKDITELDTTTPLGHAMLGHLLAQRYLSRFTRPPADQLSTWLADYAELPDARAIYALLLTRLPANAAKPQAPSRAALPLDQGGATGPVPEETEPPSFTLSRNAALDRSVAEAARRGGPAAVEKLLAGQSSLPPLYASQLRGEAAQILFTLNRDQEAYELGFTGMAQCRAQFCPASALAGQMAGLAAWRMGRIELSRAMFDAASRAELTTSALRSASAFWAARAQLRTGHPAAYRSAMQRAAAETRTFYGFLARRVLGIGYGFGAGGGDARDLLTIAHLDAVAATDEGLRAFALLQIGQSQRAEAELRQLWPAATSRPDLGRAIMLVAKQAGLLPLASQLADLVEVTDSQPRDATRFPLPRLLPNGGFHVDPAMVYGIARTESNFDTALVSGAGATGLMQIMPDTASFLIGREADGALRGSLRDPGVNLDLGQRYVGYLAQHDAISGDLLKLLAAYNSGPGNFAKWGPSVRDLGDPLLFIEAIPIDETRHFVPRALTYTWIYATRMKLPTPSLDELAAGDWPRYHKFETETASN